jgi:alkylhydroperoxidase family enzyme
MEALNKMARIPYPEKDEVTKKVRKLTDPNNRLNILRMMSRAGNIADAFATFAFEILAGGTLNPVLREMAILRVGYLSGSDYEVFYHEGMIRRLKVGEDKIRAIREEINSPLLSETERLVLEITDQIVHHVKMDDRQFERLHALLSQKDAMELVMAISFYMMACRFLENYEIDLDDEKKQ